MIKFVVSDLDGTLLKGYDNIGEYTIEILRKLIDSGVEFAVATGRGKQGVDFLLEKLNRKIYIICNNGANIYDKEGKNIFGKMIEKKLVIKILKTIREEGMFYNAFDRENFYFDKNDPTDFSGRRKSFVRCPLEKIENIPDISKIIVIESPENIIKISKILKEKYGDIVEVTISDPECVDLVPKNCSKGNGIISIGKLMNILPEEVMAFGDGENDLDMLKKVGFPVAMENAQEVVKNEIKNRAISNIEEGVAKYIQEYFNL